MGHQADCCGHSDSQLLNEQRQLILVDPKRLALTCETVQSSEWGEKKLGKDKMTKATKKTKEARTMREQQRLLPRTTEHRQRATPLAAGDHLGDCLLAQGRVDSRVWLSSAQGLAEQSPYSI